MAIRNLNTQYTILTLGNTTQAQWNTTANTSGVTYAVGTTFSAVNDQGVGTGTALSNSGVTTTAGNFIKSSALQNSLLNNDPFNYAHLVKFERPLPFPLDKKKASRKASSYTYITDGAFDIVWDDGSKDRTGNSNGAQNYNANKLGKIGSITETTEAKASSTNITLDTAALGASITTSSGATGGLNFYTGSIVLVNSGDISFIDAGFREGDKILFTSTNSAAPNRDTHVIIKTFINDGRGITYTPVDTISTNTSGAPYTISLASEELKSLTLDKAGDSYSTYMNREVFIYKAHMDIDTNAIIGEPYLIFKGIITNGQLTEDPGKNSSITWTLSSHWGDFSRVSGRLTVDEAHRALDGSGEPDEDAVIRKEYMGDLGFAHANQSLSVMALYNEIEISYKQVDINGGWPGGKRLREVENTVERRTDLNFNLSPKYLPVAYGVNKLDAIPIFVDTANTNAAEIYVAYAMCEGQIGGLLDLYIDGNSSICVDKADSDLRSTAAENVDLVCTGRMDRGNALAGYNASQNGGSNNSFVDGFVDHEDFRYNVGNGRGPFSTMSYNFRKPRQQIYSTNSTGTDTAGGLQHNRTHTIDSPITGHFQFHAGKPNQAANSTLVSKAASNGFKIQNNYYENAAKNTYWTNQHQLLDTAYVVSRFTIASGETSIPEIDFVVRGKGIECHNYDRTYNNTNVFTTPVTPHTSFSLGDTVYLRDSSGNAITGVDESGATVTSATQTIIDKWSFLDVDGITQYRFKTDWDHDITTNFYMQRTSDSALKWYAAPVKSTSDVTGTVANASKTTIANTSANSSTGIDIEFDQSTEFQAALAAIAALDLEEVGAIGFDGIGSINLGSIFNSTYNASSNTIEQVGTSTTQTVSSEITEIFVKDAIILNNTAQADGFYTGMAITLSRADTEDNVYAQERTIVGYTNAGNVAIVNAPWDEGYYPDAGDTYVISAGRPDVRVSLNPAMQLLDYLTSTRYGAGLDIDLDIDLETFKQAARDCDTKSDVTVITTTAPTPEDSYEYAPGGIVHFRGKVASVNTIVADINGDDTNETYYEVVFTDVMGKLGRKWNDWESFRPDELIWKDKKLYKKTTALSTYTVSNSNLVTAQNLTKVGASSTVLALNLDSTPKGSSANGNPIVKSATSAPTAAGVTFNASGYSLYDSDDVKYWKYIGWDSNGQRNVTRHQMNQVISTSNPVFDNINLMLKQFNGILRFSNGLYALDVKGQTPLYFVNGETINEEDIIGSVSVKDGGLKKSYNSVSSSIKDPQTRFEGRSVSFFNSTYLKQDKSIPKKGSYGMPGITNYYNARFNVNQYLDESRFGLSVSFKMMPKGILLLPGSIIKLSYERFGWVDKELRISNLVMGSDCLVNVTAEEHNNNAYVIKKISEPTIGEPISSVAPVNLNTPAPPTSLTGAGKVPGTFVLTWTNSADFDPNNKNHSTELYVNEDGHNDRNHATTKLIAEGLRTTRYDHKIFDGETNTTQYFWVKHVVTRNTKNGPREIRSVTSPNTTAGVSTAAPIRHKGKWNIAVSSLPTTPALANTRWGDGTGERPSTPIAGDEAWFFTGNQNAPTGQKIWQYTGSTWTEITQAIRGDVMVDGTVTTTEIANGTILADNIDQTATGGRFGEIVAAVGTFSVVDTDVLNANSVIAREIQVFPDGGTAPTINGTTLAGAGIDLKQDGDIYVGDAAANKYLFWDQSAGTMTFRGTLNVDDIVGSSATFATLMAEVATIGTLNTQMLDSEAIVTRDIRVGPSDEITAGSFVTNTEYYITDLGNTTQAQWNSVAGTSGQTYNLGGIFTAQNAGTGTGKARNRTTVAKIVGTTLTGAGAHLNADGDFYVGNAATNKYMFWDQSAGTMTLRGELNADDITAGTIDATTINVDNLSSLSANLGAVTAGTLSGGTIPEATSAPTGTEAGAFLDLGVGRMIFGNASKYIWWDGTNLTINGVTISNSTLQQATGVATETYVDTAISNLVDTAPTTLDTLNELAAALGDDPNFAASVSTSLGNKVSTTSHQALSANANALEISGSTITLTRGDGSTDTVTTPNTIYNAGSGLSLSGNTFSNSAPDQTVAITGGSNITVSGTYPNFTVTGTDTDTTYSAGSGITLTGTTFSNAAPDQTVSLTGGGGATITGTYPNFTITTANTVYGVATSSALGLVKIGYTESGKNYPVELSSQRMYVNVPWVNTEYGVGDGGLTQKNFTTTLKNKLDGIAAGANLITNNNQLTNGAGYVTNADGGNAATFGGSLPSAYVKTDQAAALSSAANAMTISGSTITLARGDGTTDTVTTPNTEYSVGDGGLTQKNFTTTLKSKLDGIATGANLITNNNQLTNGAGYITNSGGTTASTVNTVVKRDASGDINVRLLRSEYDTTNSSIGYIMTQIDTGTNNYVRPSTPAQLRSALNVADGANVTPSWVPASNPNYLTSHQDISGKANLSGATFTGVIDANGGHGGINITSTSILSAATSSWTGNPGANGKIQYHSNRWYIVSDSSSNRIVQFRRDGADKSYIDNNGKYMGDTDLLDGQHGAYYLAYGNFSGTPTIPSGNQIIDWTVDQGATNIHAGNYLNTNTTNFGIRAETGAIENISEGETVTFRGVGATSVSRTGNNIDISSTNTDRYVNSASFNTGNGILTLTRAGSDTAQVTVDLDGRYATVNDTGTPAILSNGSTPSLNSGISAAEVRNLIGAGTGNGTSNLAIGTTATTAMAGNTTFSSGVTTINETGNALSVANGTSATVTLSAHANLEALAGAGSSGTGSLDLEILKADTVIANKITANTITMNKLQTAPVSGQGTVAIGTAGIRILDASGTLRIAIGNLSRLATSHNNA